MESVYSAPPTSLQYRRLLEPSERIEHFRLRHDIWLEMGYRQRPAPSGLDIDAYDPYSDAIGLFEDGRMVGGIRVIWPASSRTPDRFVQGMLAALGHSLAAPAALPLAAGWDYRPLVGDRSVVEFSRTFALPEVRGRGVGLKLAHAAFGLAAVSGAVVGLGESDLAHVGFYSRAGALVVEEAGVFTHPTVRRPSRALLVDLQALPEEVRILGRQWAPQEELLTVF